MVVMDQVAPTPRCATAANTDVECSCVGLVPGAVYPRQLLDALLMVSGNDAATALADMVGGFTGWQCRR